MLPPLLSNDSSKHCHPLGGSTSVPGGIFAQHNAEVPAEDAIPVPSRIISVDGEYGALALSLATFFHGTFLKDR